MTYHTRQKQLYQRDASPKSTYEFVTIGTVVDTNDPQQMGRIRAVCPTLGDSFQSPIDDVPWCIYTAPFGGQTQVGTRGPGIQESKGGISYGAWFIPKVGAQVLIMCLDGNPNIRIYVGCIYDQLTPHTLPHGRWMYDDHPKLEKTGSDARPYGPYTSTENFIQPLADNLQQAFGDTAEPNFEWRTRAADYTVAAVDVTQLSSVAGAVADDKDATWDGWVSRQGYQINRQDPMAPSKYTERNFDSMIYSITTPGFHSLSMDDRQENSRIRFRTTAGHQVILDDTNERIYVSTAKGNNWIEIDQAGNIDIFTTNKVNVRAKKDINFTSDETIRMYGAKGIHMYSGDEIRMQAQKDVHVKTEQNVRLHAAQSVYFQADVDVNVKTGANLFLDAMSSINAVSGSQTRIQAAGLNLNGGPQILQTAAQIHLNGPTAAPAAPASPANDQPAMWTNRVPDHEPWARTMTANDFTHAPELPYTDRQVGRVERGSSIPRGSMWRR